MKTKIRLLTLTLIAIFSFNKVTAQFTPVPPWNLFNFNDNIGLQNNTGIFTPSYKLDVQGDVNIWPGFAYKWNGVDLLKINAPDNIALGFGTGTTTGTAIGNIFVGTGVGTINTSGNYNSYFGYGADGVMGIYNSTAIGYKAFVGNSNSLVLGGTGAYAVNVGIGTSSPAAQLDVVGTVNISTLAGTAGPVWASGSGVLYRGTENYWSLSGNAITGTEFLGTPYGNTNDLIFKTNGTVRMNIDQNGYTSFSSQHIGINGSYNPSDALYVHGNTTLDGDAFIAGNARFGHLVSSTMNLVFATSTGELTLSSSGYPTWLLTGNAGTTPGTSTGQNYIGTTDPTDLVFATSGNECFRIRDHIGGSGFLGYLGIGNTTPNYKLDVGGDINIDNSSSYKQNGNHILSATGATGTSLKNLFIGYGSTGSTVSSFSYCNFIGYEAGNSNRGSNNIFIGNQSGYQNIHGEENTFVGNLTGKNTNGNSARANTMLGFSAGLGATTGSNGINNTFIGHSSGGSIFNGHDNTFVGYLSGFSISNGFMNTVVGKDAGYNLINGQFNTFIGGESGKNNTTQFIISVGSGGIGTYTLGGTGGDQLGNTFIGHKSGRDNTTGDANVFSGSWAGLRNTVGIFNCFYGHRAGENNVNGSENTMLGNFAGLGGTSIGTLSGCTSCTSPIFEGNVFIGSGSGQNYDAGANTYLGTNTVSLGDHNVLLGYYATAGGAVPGTLPTTTPAWLRVSNAIAIGSHASATTSSTMALGGTGTDAVQVVIGYNSPTSYTLEVNGDAYFSTTYYPSDERYKKNIENFKNSMEIIRKLRPVKFEFKDNVYRDQKNAKSIKMNLPIGNQIGFIAQELKQYIPEAVMTKDDGYLAVNYNHLFGIIVKGIQEQDSNITQQKNVIDSLINQNASLTNSVNDLNKRLSALEQGANNNQTQMNNIGSGKTGTKSNESFSNNFSSNNTSYLQQNVPNPFKDNTTIEYYLTTNTQKASLLIFTMNGTLLKTIPINQFAKGAVQISGGELKPGMYFYSLIADDKEVDTKKMIILE
ncbi:MAG: tail fiber domain-containing protein [Bacteroidota bacterium]